MVRAGVEQAFSTRFPDVEVGLSLTEAIVKTSSSSVRICLDNYESTSRLAAATAEANSVVLAVGSERGWSAAERNQFREHGFVLADLGERPLRSETATIAAVSIVAGQLSDGVSGP
jgi:RsmE family RNA methyltransferase